MELEGNSTGIDAAMDARGLHQSAERVHCPYQNFNLGSDTVSSLS